MFSIVQMKIVATTMKYELNIQCKEVKAKKNTKLLPNYGKRLRIGTRIKINE